MTEYKFRAMLLVGATFVLITACIWYFANWFIKLFNYGEWGLTDWFLFLAFFGFTFSIVIFLLPYLEKRLKQWLEYKINSLDKGIEERKEKKQEKKKVKKQEIQEKRNTTKTYDLSEADNIINQFKKQRGYKQ